MSLAVNFRRLREARGETLDDVARGTRLHAPLLRCVEIGRPATADQVARIARHLGVGVEDLAG